MLPGLKKERVIKTKTRICKRIFGIFSAIVLAVFLSADSALAIQLHQGNEGIIVHQVGHLFFLLSMVVLVFIITGRQLNQKKGWRLIQYSAILFIIWNLDTILAHFFDNQIRAVTVKNLSLWQVKISAMSGSEFLVLFYHSLKLDHIFCVPALYLFYRGLANLVAQERYDQEKKKTDQNEIIATNSGTPAVPSSMETSEAGDR